MSEGSPRLVFLYGPPAVGKLTIAKKVAARCGFRVLHNHITLDAVAQVLPFGTPTFWETVARLRRDLVVAAAGEGVDLVYTFVFAPGDESHVDNVVAAYESAGGSVFFVRLVASHDELFRRVTLPDRALHGKITDAGELARLLDAHDVLAAIPGRQTLTIDTDALSAAEAAECIIRHTEGLES